ncbi:hypothetical protein BH24ACT7_BH24ACT7_23690 [soil metagenome]
MRPNSSGQHDENPYLNLRSALAAGRAAVDQRWKTRAEQDMAQTEEPLTEDLLMAAYPTVRHATFTKPEEGRIGADWLWWFTDSSGECFGMLVQAKVRKERNGHHEINLRYDNRSQIRSLLATSDAFEVPAAYVLYMGPAVERAQLSCGAMHEPAGCGRCPEMSVAAISAIAADQIVSNNAFSDRVVEDVVTLATPLESIADPRAGREDVSFLYRSWPDDDLVQLLRDPQTGSRAVAKAIVHSPVLQRLRQFAAVAIAPTTMTDIVDSPRVFTRLPDDRGHFGVPYLEHLLRGLRTRLPSYVHAALDGRRPTQDGHGSLAGLVLAQV